MRVCMHDLTMIELVAIVAAPVTWTVHIETGGIALSRFLANVGISCCGELLRFMHKRGVLVTTSGIVRAWFGIYALFWIFMSSSLYK